MTPRLPIVQLNGSVLWAKATSLRQPCRPLDVNNAEELALAQTVMREMFRTLYAEPSGVALAAPQIGFELEIAVISYRDRESDRTELMGLINPTIVRASDETNEDEEICLSVPNLTGKVRRASLIEVKGYDHGGHQVRLEAKGFFARVIQHEVDHLSGILYVDRVSGELREVPDFPERRLASTVRSLKLGE